MPFRYFETAEQRFFLSLSLLPVISLFFTQLLEKLF